MQTAHNSSQDLSLNYSKPSTKSNLLTNQTLITDLATYFEFVKVLKKRSIQTLLQQKYLLSPVQSNNCGMVILMLK